MERAEAEAILDGDRETALALLMQVAELIEANRRLESRIADLEQRLSRNSHNSSLPPSADPPSAQPRRRRGRIGRGWQRGVVRVSAQALFEIGDAALKPPVRLDQLCDLHQQGECRLPVAVEYRLRLGAFHDARVRRAEAGPSLSISDGDLNAYRNLGPCRTFPYGPPPAVTPVACFLNLVSLVRFQPGAPRFTCSGRCPVVRLSAHNFRIGRTADKLLTRLMMIVWYG